MGERCGVQYAIRVTRPVRNQPTALWLGSQLIRYTRCKDEHGFLALVTVCISILDEAIPRSKKIVLIPSKDNARFVL